MSRFPSDINIRLLLPFLKCHTNQTQSKIHPGTTISFFFPFKWPRLCIMKIVKLGGLFGNWNRSLKSRLLFSLGFSHYFTPGKVLTSSSKSTETWFSLSKLLYTQMQNYLLSHFQKNHTSETFLCNFLNNRNRSGKKKKKNLKDG